MISLNIMTLNPTCCHPEEPIQLAAQKMIENDCGELPVVEGRQIIGVITDRDICCRAVSKGLDATVTTVRDCMTSPAITVKTDMTLEDCCQVMEEYLVRRVPVVDQTGQCCGMISQADLAKKSDGYVEHLVREISYPSARNPSSASWAGC